MKHSILLGAALALAIPAQAAFENFQVGVGATYLSTVLGDPKGSEQGLVASNITQSNGTVTSIAYTRPALDAFASVTFADHFKISGEVMVSDTKERTIHDGASRTVASQTNLAATLLDVGLNAGLAGLANHDAGLYQPLDALIDANNPAGITFALFHGAANNQNSLDNADRDAIDTPTQAGELELRVNLEPTFGKRLLKVKPSYALAAKAEYVFGDDANHGASLGVAFLRTKDEFTYTHGRLDANGALGDFAADDDSVNGGTFVEKVSTFKDGVNWLGVTGSTASQITDSLSLYGNASYYMRDFKKSKTDAAKADIFTKEVKAKCFNGSIGLSFSPGSDE